VSPEEDSDSIEPHFVDLKSSLSNEWMMELLEKDCKQVRGDCVLHIYNDTQSPCHT
jgi:hypothetical protein